jgi:hypothetical protein
MMYGRQVTRMTRPVSRRSALRLGSVAVLGLIAGCQRSLISTDQPPEIPIYLYNANVKQHKILLRVTSKMESNKNSQILENLYRIEAHTTRKLTTIDIERFKLKSYIDDTGDGLARIKVTPEAASYSPAGYLFVIDSETVNESQLQSSPSRRRASQRETPAPETRNRRYV